MTYVTHNDARPEAQGVVTRMIADVTARWARYSVYRKTLSELSVLSDRELSDLGIHRSMIRRMAFEAAYAK